MALSSSSNRGPRKASSIKPRKVEWIYRERIPRGMISVVAGKPDQGKGLFSAHVAAEVSKRGVVIYSAIEDSEDQMTGPRLQAAGANMDNVLIWRFGLPTDFDALVEHVVDNEVRLICMDPFAAHLHGYSKSAANIREILNPLSDLAEQTNCAILITEHALKRVPQKAHPLSAIGGASSGLPAASRMAFVFGADPADEDRRLLCTVKSNLRQTPKALAFETDMGEIDGVGDMPSLLYKNETEFDARRLLVDNDDDAPIGRKPEKRAAAAEWVVRYLATAPGPVRASDVYEDAKHFAIARNTLRRVVDELVDSGGVVKAPPGGGRNCTWEMTDELREAALETLAASDQLLDENGIGDGDE